MLPPDPLQAGTDVMHGAEQIMWAIASLLACWSLSVFFRVLDERRFFKKHPTSPIPRLAARWAGRAAVAALAGAIVTGWFAVWFANAVPSGRNTAIGIFHVAGGASALFAASCGFIWAIGDRSRGRRRCARCWYDMSDVPGRQCPECGREPRDESGLFRPRRTRWQLASTIVLLLAGSVMLTLASRSTGPGLMQSTPSWVLIKGWRVVPDGWFSGEDGSLADRFENAYPDAESVALGEELVTILAENPGARSREAMWHSAGTMFFGVINPAGFRQQAILDNLIIAYPRQTDLDRLAASVIEDRIKGLIACIDNPVGTIDQAGFWASIYTETWLAARMVENGALDPEIGWRSGYWRTPAAERAIRAAMLSGIDTTRPADFDSLIDHPNQKVRDEYLALAMTLGEYGVVLKHAGVLLDSDSSVGFRVLRHELPVATYCATDSERAAFYAMLSGWVRSGTQRQALAAVRFLESSIRRADILGLPDQAGSEQLRKAIVMAAQNEQDKRLDRADRPLRTRLVWALLESDFDPSISFPIVRDWAIENSDEHIENLYWYRDIDGSHEPWIEHFSDLADHPSESLRYLCAATVPSSSDSIDDPRIDAILDRLANDPDPAVYRAAWEGKTARNEARLARAPAEYGADAADPVD